MKKIYINKTDPVTLIIEKVIKATEKEVSLYIPKGSELAASRNNFKLLKRESASAGKTVYIESVDEDVIELADAYDIKSTNPFFGKKRSVTDVVIKEARKIDVADGEPEGSMPEHESSKIRKTKSILEDKKEHSWLWQSKPTLDEVRPKFALIRNKFFRVGGMLALALLLSWLAVYVLPKATIKITLEKINWDFSGIVSVSTTREAPSVLESSIEIPGQIFIYPVNKVSPYPATGSEQVERKARGLITVYNEYSSESQPLVQNTRFSTPDGKIFRTDKKITVPGAKIVDGKIVATSIEVSVTADKAGEGYNIGPIVKFRIPGLQGSPKYDAFYGTSTDPMIGGFIGEIKVPTEDDITKAKADLEAELKSLANTKVALDIPKDIKVLDKANIFSVTKEDINKEVDSSGNFSVTASGELKVFGFKQDDLMSALASKVAGESKTDLVLLSHSLQESDKGYGEPKLDITNNKMSFNLAFKSSWARPFNVEDFEAKAAGKSKSEISSLVYLIPGFRSGEVSFWPLWVRYAPKNPSKIVVDLDYAL